MLGVYGDSQLSAGQKFGLTVILSQKQLQLLVDLSRLLSEECLNIGLRLT